MTHLAVRAGDKRPVPYAHGESPCAYVRIVKNFSNRGGVVAVVAVLEAVVVPEAAAAPTVAAAS